MGVSKAKQLVESLLEADEVAQADPMERAYARLQKLYTRRGELQGEQAFHATWSIALHRLGVAEDNIKSLDIDGGKLVGLWLKQGDYGAKIARKEKAKAARDAYMAADHDDEPNDEQSRVGRWWGQSGNKAPGVPQETSAYYVPVNPPIWVPEAVRRSWGRS